MGVGEGIAKRCSRTLKRIVQALASGVSGALLTERWVYLPVLVNFVSVSAETELKVAKAASTPVVKQLGAFAVPQLAKRANLGPQKPAA